MLCGLFSKMSNTNQEKQGELWNLNFNFQLCNCEHTSKKSICENNCFTFVENIAYVGCYIFICRSFHGIDWNIQKIFQYFVELFNLYACVVHFFAVFQQFVPSTVHFINDFSEFCLSTFPPIHMFNYTIESYRIKTNVISRFVLPMFL